MIQRRQEAERERNAAYDRTLRTVERAARPAPDFAGAIREGRLGLKGSAIRAAEEWRPKMKTRDPGKLLLAAARHLYARYTVPAHLEAIWLDRAGLTADEVLLRKRWFVAAARGDSLYKTEAGEWLSRKEVHAFLTTGGDFNFEEAFWFAIARTYTDDPAIAGRIARTKIASTPRGQIAWWREVVRFFCAQPTVREEIDDLCDFLAAAKRRDAQYSVKGRTLASLRRQMHDWHRDVAAIERIEQMRRRAQGRAALAKNHPQGGRWEGASLADWEWKPSAQEATTKGERFVVRQLLTAEDLVYESRAMHHCVSTYAAKCISGNASIWVLRRATHNRIDRLLTIELDRQHRAIQVRGFANRIAQPEERKILERWAKARNVMLKA
jgi:hypothetical protein